MCVIQASLDRILRMSCLNLTCISLGFHLHSAHIYLTPRAHLALVSLSDVFLVLSSCGDCLETTWRSHLAPAPLGDQSTAEQTTCSAVRCGQGRDAVIHKCEGGAIMLAYVSSKA
eukprot:2502532-Pleurochrysis_carterae.AAC.3